MDEQEIRLNADQVLQVGIQARLQLLQRVLIDQVGDQVQAGPFLGMALPRESSWGANGDFLPKLLGCYEQELQGVIERAIRRKPSKVFNIGCAEGYYAIGMARCLPDARVWAVDKEPRALEICRRMADLNGVSSRMEFLGWDDCLFNETAHSNDHCLAIVDVEGDELTVLDEIRAAAMKNTDVIVECHDFQNPDITRELLNRFSDSHFIEQIEETARMPLLMPLIRDWGQIDRALASCEFRPTRMNWIAAWSK
jgi:precorrin-6B methylase 2